MSVDDGHPDDLKAAELLLDTNIKATFYVSANNPERPLMAQGDIMQISEHFELGAHTLNHRTLTGLHEKALRDEIVDGKNWLEQVIGTQVVSFCYPKGKFDRNAMNAVEQAGFLGARTCMYNLLGAPSHPQAWGLSTQAYSHTVRIQLQHALIERNWRGIRNYLSHYQRAVDWVEHFQLGLNYVLQHGGIAHLYLHSWEISETKQWKRLRNLLREIGRMDGLRTMTNGEVFALWRNRNDGCSRLNPSLTVCAER